MRGDVPVFKPLPPYVAERVLVCSDRRVGVGRRFEEDEDTPAIFTLLVLATLLVSLCKAGSVLIPWYPYERCDGPRYDGVPLAVVAVPVRSVGSRIRVLEDVGVVEFCRRFSVGVPTFDRIVLTVYL